MDLETVGKKMLEALAVQGQITAMQTELLDLQRGVARATDDIQKSQETKALNIEARERTENALSDAIANVEASNQQVAQAKASLKSAEAVIGQTEEELAKYSDAILSQLDEVTQQFQDAKRVIEAERSSVQKEIEVLKKDLETRQAELKDFGIELNIGGAASQSKTVSL